MGYVAIQTEGKRAFFSKGANKLARELGCNASTITKNLLYVGSNHEIKGYTVTKTHDLTNKNRGMDIKSVFYEK